MKKEISKKVEMRPEYDFTSMVGGIQGKYYKAYRAGHSVKIHKADGTTLVQRFKLEDGAVIIEPKIREYFPNSEAVNKALSCLIPLLTKSIEQSETLLKGLLQSDWVKFRKAPRVKNTGVWH